MCSGPPVVHHSQIRLGATAVMLGWPARFEFGNVPTVKRFPSSELAAAVMGWLFQTIRPRKHPDPPPGAPRSVVSASCESGFPKFSIFIDCFR
jgi:hypothetical protein